MNTILCPLISDNFEKAASRDLSFDSPRERDELDRFEAREHSRSNVEGESFKTNLFFGFFFDGTRNNYEKDEASKDQSNVARLYDIYPGLSVQDVLPKSTNWKHKTDNYNHFFRVYIAGVASPFKQVNDSGEGWAATFGGAGGKKGCDRIVWALIQGINSVIRYFHNRPLISADEKTALSNRISLSCEARRVMTQHISPSERLERNNWNEPRIEFEKLLRRLHASVSLHWSNCVCGPAKKDPGIVEKIHISTFGFSRGSTQARAFANWLDSLCQLDAMLRGTGSSSLGGVSVVFDFLGLFDSVA